jgi:hypothetical protein
MKTTSQTGAKFPTMSRSTSLLAYMPTHATPRSTTTKTKLKSDKAMFVSRRYKVLESLQLEVIVEGAAGDPYAAHDLSQRQALYLPLAHQL